MRSMTSYFNGTLYRKTLARFWPLWGMWGVMWLFLLPLRLLNSYLNQYHFRATSAQESLLWDAKNIPETLSVALLPTILFAVLCAMAVFGYLYNHRSACWTHALPLRREALFTTQYLAGLSMMLLPLAAAGVLTAMVEISFLPMGDWGRVLSILLTWLLAQCGICLFFFSFAAFCAMFTGHILALPAFYFILNFLAAGVWYLVDALMNEFYYGYAGVPGALDVVEYLTPAAALEQAVTWGYGENGNLLRSSGTVAAYAAVGVALAVVSLYVYRRRHVETAGDVVAVALVRPLFKYGVSFCSGLAFGMFTAAFFGWNELPILIPCILIWTIVGYFAAEMLLKKSFRVFKAWKGGAVMTGVILLLCLVCLADIFGVVDRVPDASQVKQINVQVKMGYPNDSGQSLNRIITDPDQIAKIVALHQAIVDDKDRTDWNSGNFQPGDGYTHLTLDYALKGGGTLSRRYSSVSIYTDDLDTPGTAAYAMKQILDDRDLAAQAYDFENFMKNSRLTSAYLNGLYYNGEYYGDYFYLDNYRQELWDAVQQDFAEGTIGVRWLFEYSQETTENTYTSEIVFEVTHDENADGPSGYQDESYVAFPSTSGQALRIALTPNARHTLAVLEKAGIFEEGYALAEYEPDYDPRYPDTAAGDGWEIVY